MRFRVGDMPPLAEGFTRRPDTARGLLEVVVPGAAVALVPGPETGEGGPGWLRASGKTQMAVMLAETLWRSAEVDSVVWISAATRPAVLSGYAEAWTAATGIEPTGPTESVAARFVSWLSETRRRWLVVLDDLLDADELDGLWPEGPAGRVVITSTNPAVAAGRRRTRIFPVGFFSVREALDCLTDRLSMDPGQRRGAIDLIDALGGEPLALAQAAAVVASSPLTCWNYCDHFARSRQQMEAAAGGAVAAASVTWALSLAQAEVLLPGQSVRLLLALLALLDGHGIPGTIFGTRSVRLYLGGAAAGFGDPVDPEPAWDALLVLARVGLVTIGTTGTEPVILMIPAVQAAISAAVPTVLRDRAARAAANALLETWPADEPHPSTAAGLRANAGTLQKAATDTLWAQGCHPLLLRAGRSLDSARLAGPAVGYWRDLAVGCDNKLPPGHPDALLVADELAGAYLAAGYQAEAVAWYRRVLAERSSELAPGHPAVIAARVSLAGALIAAGEPGAAVTALQRAAEESGQFHSPGHPDALAVRDELAGAYEAVGDVAAAIRLLTQTLADRERFQGSRDVRTMATRNQLAAALLAGGKMKQAICAYGQVLADREAVLGRDNPDTVAARASLADAYYAAGKMPLAAKLSEEACADSARALGADHVGTLTRRARLATFYYALGRVGDAQRLLRETLARCEQILPYGDPLTQTVRQSLASIAGGG
jgi:tetratricopeptide (TPR) repeat protein